MPRKGQPGKTGPHRARHAGTVYRDVDKRGYVTWRVRVRWHGRTVSGASVGVRKGLTERAAKALAERNLRELLGRLDAGQPPDPQQQRQTLTQFARRWLAQRALTIGTPRASIPRYEAALRLHVLPLLGAVLLVAVGPGVVQEWRLALLRGRRELGGEDHPDEARSMATVRFAETVLRMVLLDARRQEHRINGAALEMRHVQVEVAEAGYLDAAQQRALLAATRAERPWYLLWRVLGRAALRIGEGTGLPWGALDVFNGGVEVRQQVVHNTRDLAPKPKGGSRGFIPLPRDLVAELDQHRRDTEATLGRPVRPDELIFLHDGQPIRYDEALANLRRGLRQAEVAGQYGTHAFRHGFGQIAAEVAPSEGGVQQTMRHRSAQTTRKYRHRNEAAIRQTVEAVDRSLRGPGEPVTPVLTPAEPPEEPVGGPDERGTGG